MDATLGTIVQREAALGPGPPEFTDSANQTEAQNGVSRAEADQQVPLSKRGRGGRRAGGGRPATGRTTRAYTLRLPLEWVDELERRAADVQWRGGKGVSASRYVKAEIIRLLSGGVLVGLTPDELAVLERRARRRGMTPAEWATNELRTRLSKEARPGEWERTQARKVVKRRPNGRTGNGE